MMFCASVQLAVPGWSLYLSRLTARSTDRRVWVDFDLNSEIVSDSIFRSFDLLFFIDSLAMYRRVLSSLIVTLISDLNKTSLSFCPQDVGNCRILLNLYFSRVLSRLFCSFLFVIALWHTLVFVLGPWQSLTNYFLMSPTYTNFSE